MTALRFSKSAFTPPQAKISQPGWMKASAGKGPLQIAQACVANMPSITKSSIIHDNGCGDGNVTRTIMSLYDPERIHATDIAEDLLQVLESDAQEQGWPVKTALMPAQDLTFADNTFTHSIMNCVILRLSDADATKACAEIFRTLQPGGVAMVSGWADVPHRMPMLAAHNATREPGSEALVGGAIRWVDGSLLRSSMENGGFKDVKMWKARSTSEIDDLDAWVEYMWSMLGRMQSGWVPSDEERWDRALEVFGDSLRNQPGVEVLENGKARLTSWCWIAMAEK
jgi:SAM-dependent methyltransferase